MLPSISRSVCSSSRNRTKLIFQKLSAVCVSCSRKRMISPLGKQSPFISFLKKQRRGPEPSPRGEVETKRHWAALHIKIRGYSHWLENGITLGSFGIFGNVESSLGLGAWLHAGGWKLESCCWGVTGKGDWEGWRPGGQLKHLLWMGLCDTYCPVLSCPPSEVPSRIHEYTGH